MSSIDGTEFNTQAQLALARTQKATAGLKTLKATDTGDETLDERATRAVGARTFLEFACKNHGKTTIVEVALATCLLLTTDRIREDSRRIAADLQRAQTQEALARFVAASGRIAFLLRGALEAHDDLLRTLQRKGA